MILATVTGTQVTLLTVTATPTALSTVTVTPTPVPTLSLASIQPATVLNDQPARIALIGGGFVDTTYSVMVGGRLLSDVRVESSTALTATLPAGLCAGPYTATVANADGHQVTGGAITLQSVRTIVQDEAATALNVPLTGWSQRRSVALPPIQIEDSGCGITDWRLILVVDIPTAKAHAKTLIPGIVTVRWGDAGGTTNVKLSHQDGHEQALGTLVIPRNGSTTLLLTPSLILDIPASAYVGSYTTTLSASFAD